MKEIKRITSSIAVMLMFACESEQPAPAIGSSKFLEYTVPGQTSLATDINNGERKIKLEIDHDVELSSFIPEFEVDGDYKVLVNGVEQISGISTVNLTETVTYNLVNTAANTNTEWQVSATPLKCKIVIDASHDGGVWWFPQAGTFDSSQPHQGQDFANLLRAKGFEVTELGRGRELSEEMFFGAYIVLRAGGFENYTQKELQVYSNLLERGMNLVLFNDHMKYDAADELADLIGVKFRGVAFGLLTDFGQHEITTGLEALDYIAGSAILESDLNSNIEVLARLAPDDFVDLNANSVQDPNEPGGAVVMGLVNHPGSRIFFFGDMNSLQIHPQPFIDNLIGWMGDCSDW